MKTGIKTSEFWMTIGTMGLGFLGQIDMPGWGYLILSGIYSVARGLAKGGVVRGTVGHVLKDLPDPN